MKIDDGLDEHMKPISSFNGVCLSIDEILKLQTVLDQLRKDIQAEEILFWGKIM